MKISIAIELDEGQYSILKKEETSTGIWYGLLSDDDVYTTTDYLEDRMIINNVQEGFYNGMQIFTYDVEFVSAAYKYGEQPEFKTTAKYEDASVLGQALFYNFDIDFFAIDNNIFRKEDLSVKIDINNLLGRGSTTLEFNQNSQDKSTVFDQIRKFWTDNDNMNTWLYHYAEDNFAERNQNVQFLIRLNPDNDIEQQSADISHEFGEQRHDMIWGSRLKEYSYGDKLHLFNNFPQEVKEEIMPAFLSRWSFSPNATLGEEILKTISGISPEGKEKIKESLLNEVNEVNDEVNPIRCLNILNFCTVFSDIKYSDINTEDLIRKTNMHSPQSVLKEIRNCLCNNEEKEKFDKDWNGSRVYYPTISEMSIAYRIWNWHYNVDSERREAKQNLIAVPIKDGLSRNDIKRIIKDDGECFKKLKRLTEHLTPGMSINMMIKTTEPG